MKERWKRIGPEQNLRVLLKRYHLTLDDYAALCVKDPVCAICGIDPSPDTLGRTLHIDHDHATGRVRGRLCNACNRNLHRLETMPGWMEAALAYLHR